MAEQDDTLELDLLALQAELALQLELDLGL